MSLLAPASRLAGQALSPFAALSIVSISKGEHLYGLYRVKQVEGRSLLVHPGIYEFPVGTLLDVEDYQYLTPTPSTFRQRVTVVESGRNGMRMVW